MRERPMPPRQQIGLTMFRRKAGDGIRRLPARVEARAYQARIAAYDKFSDPFGGRFPVIDREVA